ncbi:hypothetical protein BH10BDE1_BH10BDE1_24730 [soil metagenome]
MKVSFRSFATLALQALCLTALIVTAAKSEAQVARPDQYVLLAFDGSSAISMWKTTRAFAARSKLQKAPVNFTYFISGVYYVGKANKTKYVEPTHGAGVSAIGWGADAADLQARYDQTNLAHDEENEIASHANAHFDGSKWSLKNWHDEFKQFHTIIFDFFNFNKVTPTALYPNGWAFPEKSMVGFRAPQLGTSAGLWDTLKEFNYRYDTSKTSKSNYWPQRDPKGFWNFPLASLVIAGTGKHTLSMDYNFYYADSKALPNPGAKQQYKKQMLETYLQYFEQNYNGNRGPVHIGHHFSLWNDSAYWEAMQEFALKVCGKPEVRCVTYSQLADFMDTRTPAQIAAYQAGNFPKMAPITVASFMPALDLDVKVALLPPGVGGNSTSSNAVVVRVDGQDRFLRVQDRVEVRVNGESLPVSRTNRFLDIDSLRNSYRGQDVTVEARIVRRGTEIARATHLLQDVGGVNERVSAEPEETRALLGDLPEAHVDEAGEIDGGI